MRNYTITTEFEDEFGDIEQVETTVAAENFHYDKHSQGFNFTVTDKHGDDVNVGWATIDGLVSITSEQ